MKHVLKTLIVGVVVYLAVRFWLAVASENKPIEQAAKETALLPVKAIGTTLGLATQPDKWGAAKEIVSDGVAAMKGQTLKGMAGIGAATFDALTALTDAKPEKTLGETAQYES